MAAGVKCPRGWQCYLSSCYYASKPGDKLNQSTARSRCMSQNADLVSIGNETENEFVRNIWLVN